jgi:hypothetical protein
MISREESKKNTRTYNSRSHLKEKSFWHIISGTSGTKNFNSAREGARGTSFIQKKIHFMAAQHFKQCSEAVADAEALASCCRRQRHNFCGAFNATARQRQC